ncbi:MAG: VCBS repeat-containing protein [Planctomycetota bacterium]
MPTVTRPGTGAVVGGEFVVRWTGFGSEGTVDVELSDDGGTTFAVIADDTANDGAFRWDTTTVTDDNDYQIRVRGAEGADRTGIFSVDNTAPVLALTAPNGGELVGAAGMVTWTTTDVNPGTVQILASADSGVTYDITVANAATDSGTYAWDASGLADGTTYRVQVIATDAAGNASNTDTSDADFEVDATAPTLTLNTPNGGETLSALADITWTSTDANLGTVEILLSDNGGSSFDTTITSDAPDTGTFSWESARVEDGSNYRVRVVAIDAAGNRSTPDSSDGNFNTRNVRLQSPAHYRDVNGNGVVDAGDQIYVRYGERIVINSPVAADFETPVAGNTLGAGATVGPGDENFTVLITLGTNPVLRIRGVYDTANDADANAPSGIDQVATITADSIEAFSDGTDVSSVGTSEITVQPVPLAVLPTSTFEPRRGAVGDLDGDGDLDLVLAVVGGNPSERWEGDGDHGWTRVQQFDTDDTRDVALGDLDGDGDLDLVTAVSGPNRVWLNDGSGNLTDSAQGLGSATSQSVELADLDGDGDLDAAFANLNSMANTVWLNDGSGTFANSGQTLGGRTTQALAVADFDGDGDMDIFAANDGNDSRMWLNNGSGVFTAGVETLSTEARDVSAGDLDGDGDVDIFMSALGQKQFLRNDGNAQFPAGPDFYGNNDNRGIELFDIDLDGDLDAVSAKNLDSGRYWINDGNGNFREDDVDLLPGLANDVVIGHFDADSDVDLLVINALGEHQPYRGSASGGQPLASYTATTRTEGPWQSGDGAVGDVDSDGDDDLIISDVVGVTHVLLGDGAGDFTEGATFGTADARDGDLFDADGDGDLDYLLRSGGPAAVTDRLYRNDGSGIFADSGLTLGLDSYAPGDMDGDGDVDLVVFSGTDIEIWDGDPSGGFTQTGQTVAQTGHVVAAFADLDGDGDIDVLSADASEVRIFENDGIGALSASGTVTLADVSAIAIADLDRDGDEDLLLGTSTTTANLSWSRNDGSLTFAAVQTSLSFTNVITDLQVADRNEDGRVDLFAVDGATGNRFTNLGLGNGTFAAGGPTSAPSLSSLTLIDVDRDGDIDAYGSFGNGTTPAAVADQLIVLD